MSAPVYESPDVGIKDKPWVSVLTTHLFGGCWLLCVHTPEKHATYPVPRGDVSRELMVNIADLFYRWLTDPPEAAE